MLSAKKIHFSRTPSKYRHKVKVKKKAAFRLLKLVKLMIEFELLVLLFQQPTHHSTARYCDEWELYTAGSSSLIWNCLVPGEIKATEEQYFLMSVRQT